MIRRHFITAVYQRQTAQSRRARGERVRLVAAIRLLAATFSRRPEFPGSSGPSYHPFPPPPPRRVESDRVWAHHALWFARRIASASRHPIK